MEQQQISLQPEQIVHVALLPHIWSLPVELLANIFTLCMPEYPAPGLQIPLILGQVCCHWWATTLSMGNLWCSMDLALDVVDPQCWGWAWVKVTHEYLWVDLWEYLWVLDPWVINTCLLKYPQIWVKPCLLKIYLSTLNIFNLSNYLCCLIINMII